ncbi:MAG: DUF4388 domain-containing protein, partial [Acidobacteriota bacterium]
SVETESLRVRPRPIPRRARPLRRGGIQGGGEREDKTAARRRTPSNQPFRPSWPAMSLDGKVLLLVHPDEALRGRLTSTLRRAGARVMQATDDDEAWLRIDMVFEPDGVVGYFAGAGEGSEWIGDRIRSAVGDRIPLVVLAEDRREALRRGYDHIVGPPFDAEEVMLVTRSSLERGRSDRSLSGDLAQLPVPDLLQTASINGQSGCITLRRGPRSGQIWLRDGRVVDAQLEPWAGDEATVGRDAVLELVTWSDGTFSVDFGPVEAPERVHEPTAHLVLEAMRRLDEAERRRHPGHAGLPDEPPPPTREQKTAHLALLLLNVTASWASDHFLPDLLGRRLESSRRAGLAEHPVLDRFAVDLGGGRVAFRSGAGQLASEHIEGVARGVAAWLRLLFAELDRAMPGRYRLTELETLTEAHHDDLETLGFSAALGWSAPETATPVTGADLADIFAGQSAAPETTL